MNQEPRQENPYFMMSEEDLHYYLKELQAVQREVTREYELIQIAIVNKYRERFEK